MKKILSAVFLSLLCATSLPAAGNELRVAPHELKFQATGAGEILSLLAPAANTVEGVRWNNIIIRLPEAVPFRPKLVLKGVARVTSDSPASHVAFVVKGNHEKGGYARARVVEGAVDFEIPLSKLELGTKSANKEPFTEKDDILELRVFASFPEAVNSTLTLESLTLALAE
jgi:hypothetical protein